MDDYRMIEGKDVYSFLSAFIGTIKQGLVFSFNALRQHLILAVVTFLSISVAGVYYWHQTPPLYVATMTCMHSSLSHKTFGEMIQKLNTLAKSGSYDKLSQTLNIPIDQSKTIVDIEGYNMNGSALYEDPSADKSPMYIIVKATGNKVFQPVQKGILDYFNENNPFRKLRDTFELDMINEELTFLKSDLSLTDSVILAYSSYLKSSGNRYDTISRYQNIIKLIEYKKDIETRIITQEWRKKEMSHLVELYNGFLPPDNASRNDKKILETTAILAFFSSFFVAVIAYVSSKVKKIDPI